MKIEISSLTDVGSKRDHNEDYLLFDEELGIYIVCDGMGGHNAGEVASEMTAKYIISFIKEKQKLIQNFRDSPSNSRLRKIKDLVKESINQACRAVYEEASRDADKKGMGTTLVMTLIVNQVAIVAHVGDSRVYLIRKKKEIQITEDHSFVNDMVKDGLLKPEEAEKHPNANIITRAVGIQEFTRPDVISIELMPKDQLILCSDGLSGYLNKGELLTISKETENEELSQKLIDLANKRGGKDNITVICLQNGGKGAPPMHPDKVSVEDKERVLQQIPLFRKLNFKELSMVLEVSDIRNFKTDTYLIKEDEPGEEMFIIVKGTVAVENQQNHIADLKTGDFFGEMSLIDNAGRNASVKATSNCVTIVINRVPLFELFKRQNKIGVKILWALIQNMNKRLRVNDQKIFELERYFTNLDPEITEDLKNLDLG